MRLWRLAQSRRAASAFDADGAARWGGRWNPKGVRCVYASESAALAVLEVLVHMEKHHFGNRHVLFELEVPDSLAVESVALDDLPEDWRRTPAPIALHRIGRAWVERGASALLRVPSALTPGERNVLINPLHRDFTEIVIHDPVPYQFDGRLWKS